MRFVNIATLLLVFLASSCSDSKEGQVAAEGVSHVNSLQDISKRIPRERTLTINSKPKIMHHAGDDYYDLTLLEGTKEWPVLWLYDAPLHEVINEGKTYKVDLLEQEMISALSAELWSP